MTSEVESKKAKATGRDIILTIGHTMHRGLEPLLTQTLAPSLYQVYLHADDYDRLRGIFSKIEADAKEHLDRELARLNQAPEAPLERLGRILGKKVEPEEPPMEFKSTEGRWYFQFQEDPNGELEPGDVEVVTELAVGDEARYSSGSRTHRIISTTRRLGKMETRERTAERDTDTGRSSTGSVPVLARFRYEDDLGAHVYEMRHDQIVIGRKADDVWVDLHLETALDVSREHARVKRDQDRFFIKDLSTYGTKVDDRTVQPSMMVKDGIEKDMDHWVELPDGARIELASVVTLDFEVVRP